MSVVYAITFELRSGQQERFMALLNGVLDAMRAERSFRNAVLHADPENPHRFMLYETWESHEEVLTVQIHRPYRAEWHAALPELLASPRQISVWQPLRADGIAGAPGLQL